MTANAVGADDHEGNVVGAADPGAVVETDSDVAFEIGKAERDHSAGERDNTRSHDHA